MNALDIILIIVIAAVLAGAVLIIRSNKKKGKACPGCSESSTCCGSCKKN